MINPFARRKYIETKVEAVKSFSPAKNPAPIIRFITDFLGDGRNGKVAVTRAYEQSVWVYRAVNILMRLAHVPLIVKDREGNVIESGPVNFLLNNPNPNKDASNFYEMLVGSLVYHGNAWLIKNDGETETSFPMFLTLPMSNTMFYNKDDFDEYTCKVTRWRRRINSSRVQIINPKNLVHISLTNPLHPVLGLSPLDALRMTVDAEYAARMHNKFQMERHGRIAGIVSFDESIGTENLQILKKMWDDKYGGADNAGETAFVDNGAKYQQMSMSSKDMDWLSGQLISREEICAAFGIPPNIAGILDKATYSNYEQASLSLWTETLIPLGNKITSALNRIMGRDGQTISFDFSTVQAIQVDESVRVDRYQKLVQSRVTPERAAEISGIKLGEILPEHRVVWLSVSDVASNMQGEQDSTGEDAPVSTPINCGQITSLLDVLGRVSQGQITSESAAAIIRAAFPGMTEDSISRMVQGAIPTPKEPIAPPPLAPEQVPEKKFKEDVRTALTKAAIRDAVSYENKVSEVLKSYFYAQRKSVLERVDMITDQMKSIEKSATQYTPAEIALKLLSEKDWNAELVKRLTPIIYDLSAVAASRWIRESGARTDQIDVAMMQNFFKQQGVLIRKINETTFEALEKASRTLISGAVAGENVSELINAMKDDLRSVYNNTEARRRTIARTETLRTVNGARYEQMKASGMQYKQWSAIGDGDTRDSHSELDGQTVPMGSPFVIPSTGEEIMYPLDPGASGKETINCRCTILAVEEPE